MKKVISLLLCMALFLGLAGCGAEKSDQNQMSQQTEQSESSAPAQETTQPTQAATTAEGNEFDVADETEAAIDFSKYEEVKKDKYNTDHVPEGKQEPVEPEDAHIDKENKKTCYLSVSCLTILDNMGDLTDGKEVLVPSDGIILPRTEVEFYEGESVFDVLQRETRNRKIHMESSFVPGYNSAYIEGIGNLYEFDCGSESGWTYRVNGWFPNYGVSRYSVQEGDEIEFLYTCDLGRDLGSDWME